MNICLSSPYFLDIYIYMVSLSVMLNHTSTGELFVMGISMVIVILCVLYINNDDRHWW